MRQCPPVNTLNISRRPRTTSRPWSQIGFNGISEADLAERATRLRKSPARRDMLVWRFRRGIFPRVRVLLQLLECRTGLPLSGPISAPQSASKAHLTLKSGRNCERWSNVAAAFRRHCQLPPICRTNTIHISSMLCWLASQIARKRKAVCRLLRAVNLYRPSNVI